MQIYTYYMKFAFFSRFGNVWWKCAYSRWSRNKTVTKRKEFCTFLSALQPLGKRSITKQEEKMTRMPYFSWGCDWGFWDESVEGSVFMSTGGPALEGPEAWARGWVAGPGGRGGTELEGFAECPGGKLWDGSWLCDCIPWGCTGPPRFSTRKTS